MGAISCYQPISPHSCSLLLFLALSPPANMPINCPDCSPFWDCTAKFMTEMMIFFFLSPMHLFMISVVCAGSVLFSYSGCCLQACVYCPPCPQLEAHIFVPVTGPGKGGHLIYACVPSRSLYLNPGSEFGG